MNKSHLWLERKASIYSMNRVLRLVKANIRKKHFQLERLATKAFSEPKVKEASKIHSRSNLWHYMLID